MLPKVGSSALSPLGLLLVKSGNLRTSVYYNVYLSMEARMSLLNVSQVVFILRVRSLGQNRPLRRNTVFADLARIGNLNFVSPFC